MHRPAFPLLLAMFGCTAVDSGRIPRAGNGPPEGAELQRKETGTLSRGLERVEGRDLVLQQGDLRITKSARLEIRDARIRTAQGNPFGSLVLEGEATLETDRSSLDGVPLRLSGAARARLVDVDAGRIDLTSRARLEAQNCRIGSLVLREKATARLEGCTIDRLTLRLSGVGTELGGLKVDESVDREFEQPRGYRVELKGCRIRSYGFEVTAGTRFSLRDCPRARILIEIARGVSTFRDLRPETIRERLITNRSAALSIRLEQVAVEGWGLRALGEAVLSAVESEIETAESRRRSRIVLIRCRVPRGLLVARDRSTLELEECRVGPEAALRVRDFGRLKLFRCRVDRRTRLQGHEAGVLEAWETPGLPPARLMDYSRLLIEGRRAR